MPPASRNAIIALWMLTALGCGFRLWTIHTTAGNRAVPDAAGYDRLARNIVAGHPYSRDVFPPYLPEYERPFLYPAFVAAIYEVAGPNRTAVFVVQAFIGALLIPVAWAFTRRIAPRAPERVALIAAALIAIDPMLVSDVATLLRETLAGLVIGLLAWTIAVAWDRGGIRPWIGAGALIGIGSLIRQETIALVFAVPVVLGYAAARKKFAWKLVLRYSVATFLPALVILAPWVQYYHDHFGRWSLGPGLDIGLTARAVQLAVGPDSATTMGRALAAYRIDPRRDRIHAAYELFHAVGRDSAFSHVATTELVGGWAREIEYRDPGRWIAYAARDAINASMGYADLEPFVGIAAQERFTRLRYAGLLREGHYAQAFLYFVSRFVIGALVIVGMFAALAMWLGSPGAGLFLPIMIGGIVLPTAYIGHYLPRVRAPYDALMLVCAVIGWVWIVDRWRARQGNATRDA